jgi:cbb3-type cytochrome oxidase maturation protein
MSYLTWLIPIALLMGTTALLAFLWSLRDGQYEDLEGAAERILLDQDEDRPASGHTADLKR